MKYNFLLKVLMVNKKTNDRVQQAVITYCEEEDLAYKAQEGFDAIIKEFGSDNILIYLDDIKRI